MKTFLDTSAVIKLYHAEAGSEQLETYLEEHAEVVF